MLPTPDARGPDDRLADGIQNQQNQPSDGYSQNHAEPELEHEQARAGDVDAFIEEARRQINQGDRDQRRDHPSGLASRA